MVKVLVGLFVFMAVGCAEVSPGHKWSSECQVQEVSVKVEEGFSTDETCEGLAGLIGQARASYELGLGQVDISSWEFHMVTNIDGQHGGWTYQGDRVVELLSTWDALHEMGHIVHGDGHPAPFWCQLGQWEESLHMYGNGNENGYLTACPE